MTFELTISRLIPATPEEVFDAYTDPEKQKVWFNIIGEPGIIEATADLRVGGHITNVWGPNEDELFRETNTIRVFDPPSHLATSSTGSDPSGMTMDTEVDIRFEPVDGGTLVTVVQTGFPTEELRDFFTTFAWVGAFDRITKFLEQAR